MRKMDGTPKYAQHKLDEAIKQGEPDETIAYWRGYRDCAKALEKDRFPDTTKMVKLTLEQLREMDGKPVWIVESPNWGHWELSEDAEDYLCDRDTDLYGLTYPDPDGKAGLHKLGWIAYSYPPAQIDREAWISVKDRLPEPDDGKGVYWVAKKKNNGQWQMKMALFCDYGYAMPIDAKTDVAWRDFDYTKIVNVSHWMPLPEPPVEMEKRLRGR